MRWLLALTVLAGLAPWPIGPEPHLFEKLRWLAQGTLTHPIDVFDLAFHAFPSLLLLGTVVANCVEPN